MKLLHISLLVCLLLAVTVEGAKKRKNNHRDRDDVASSRQTEDDQLASRKEDETVLKGKENSRRKEKEEKEEKPLKKAEDESSSEEEDKKDKENKTTIAPSRKRRDHDDRDIMNINRELDLDRYYRTKRADSTLKKAKELDHIPMHSPDAENTQRSGRSRRAENTLQKAKEMEQLPMNNNNGHQDPPTRHRPRRAENTLKKAKEMDQIPMDPSNENSTPKGRSRRAENSHAQTGEVILARAQEVWAYFRAVETVYSKLNDGEKMPFVIDETAGSRPDYRKNSRTRRNGEIVLGKAQELNGGERTEIARDETAAARPDYRKNSRTRLERHLSRARRAHTSSSQSEENTLKKATELNDGEKRPVDKLPSQSTMPEKVKAHKRRAVRHLNWLPKTGPGNTSDERDSEEWKKENEEDYDDGGNSK